jgi:peptidyl-prolyl cis-trans isomerase C
VRKLTLIFVAIALITTAFAVAQEKTAQTTADPVVIRAGDVQVTKSEFEAALKTIPAEYQAYASGPGKKAFAEDYLRMKLLAREAEKHGLEKKPEVIQQLRLMRENALANAELNRIEESVKITDAELQKAYEEKKQSYQQAKARHILIAFQGSPAQQQGKKELTEEEAKAKAEEIRKKIAAGADFAEVAKTESDDRGSGSRGGELGTFSRGQMVPEFEQAVFGAKSGELTPVVRTQFGYHIIKVDELKTQSLDEVKAELEREIRQKKLQERLDQLKNASAPTFDEAYFTPPAPPTPPAAPEQTPKPNAPSN